MPKRPRSFRPDLDAMSTEDLQKLCRDIAGVNTKVGNRQYLLITIRRALLAKLMSPQDQEQPIEPVPPRIPVHELRQYHQRIVGRPTKSMNPKTLRNQIRQAQKGQVVVGTKRLGKGPAPDEYMMVSVRLDSQLMVFIEAGWKRLGIRNRTTLFRRALYEFLVAAGEHEAAAALGRWLHAFDVPIPMESRPEIELPAERPIPRRGTPCVLLSLRLEPGTVKLLDAASDRLLFQTRMGLIRTALHRFFATHGEADIAGAIEPWLPRAEENRRRRVPPAVIKNLRTLHEKVVGTPATGKSAEHLRVRISKALEGRRCKQPDKEPAPWHDCINVVVPVEPWRLALIDAGWRRMGIRTRAAFLRLALHDYFVASRQRGAVAALKPWIKPFDVPLDKADRVGDIDIPAGRPSQGGGMDARLAVLLEPQTVDLVDQACWQMRLRTRLDLFRAALSRFFRVHDEPELAAALEDWQPEPRPRRRKRR